MPQSLARQLAQYIHQFPDTNLPDETVTCVQHRLLDSLACILGAYGAPPIESATHLASLTPTQHSSIFGTTLQTTPELAAFINGIMVRFLDYNDGYMGLEPGHPSDNIPGCLALAETENSTGKELIAAIALAYEIQINLQDAASLNRHGWDHTIYTGLAMAAAAAKLMKLNEQQTEETINIALSTNTTMRQVRSGKLSDWKGCAAANAARNAIFAAQLARQGITGPTPIFEGKMGFFKQISGSFTLDLSKFGSINNENFAILRSLTKTFPTNGELHTAVWAAIDLKSQIQNIEDIEAINIETSEFNCRALADSEEKWKPQTRETADHSLPYNVARALLDGDINLDSYQPENISDPKAIALMRKITVTEDPHLTSLFPKHLANRVSVTLTSGKQYVSEMLDGPGTPENPMTYRDFEHKFRRMAEPHISMKAQNEVLHFVNTLANQTHYDNLFSAMRK